MLKTGTTPTNNAKISIEWRGWYRIVPYERKEIHWNFTDVGSYVFVSVHKMLR